MYSLALGTVLKLDCDSIVVAIVDVLTEPQITLGKEDLRQLIDCVK